MTPRKAKADEPPDQERPLDGPEREILREMMQWRKVRHSILTGVKHFLIWGAGTLLVIASVREQVVSILTFISHVITGSS